MKGNKVPDAVVKRMPKYFRHLYDLKRENREKIVSSKIAKQLGFTASQVRQDFNRFGGFGQQGFGYSINTLFSEVSSILGVDMKYKAVIVGMGHLGHTIATNFNFEKRGVVLSGLFDISDEKIGGKVGNLTIYHFNKLESFCKREKPDIAILTLTKENTERAFKELKSYGIKGFWNFSNIDLPEDENIVIENVHLGDSLMYLTYKLKND